MSSKNLEFDLENKSGYEAGNASLVPKKPIKHHHVCTCTFISSILALISFTFVFKRIAQTMRNTNAKLRCTLAVR